MEFLRDLFANFASGLIRLAVVVGILAAAYLFIIKPVLHTTENVSNTVNSSIESANKSFERSFGPHSQTSRALRNAGKQVQIKIHHSIHIAKLRGTPQKLLHCVEASRGDVYKMQRCTIKFSH